MALRYLGRKMGVPALRRQLASTPRRDASSTSQSSSHQGGHNNGAWDWKPLTHVDVNVAKQIAEFKAECEAVRKAFEEKERNRRLLIGSCFTGVGMALLVIWYTTYTEWKRGEYFFLH